MKLNFAILLVVIKSYSLFSQQQSSYTLKQAVDYAIQNSPNYLNANDDLKLAAYRKNEIMAIGLPQITGSFDFKYYIEIPTTLLPANAFNPMAPADAFAAIKFGLKYNSTAGVNASQLLFSSDYLFGVKAAKEFIALSKINAQRTKTEVISQVSKAYYTVLINKERLKLLDANIEKLTKSYNELKQYNQQGFVELIDVERLEVAKNNLTTEKEKVNQMLGIGENLLKFQMGYPINNPIQLSDSLNSSGELNQELNPMTADVNKRDDYQLLKAQESLLNLDVKRLKWGYLPTIAAYGAYQYNTMRPNANIFEFDKNNPVKKWFPIALVGVTMNLTIFDGLQRHYKIQQAKVTANKNVNTLRNLELAAQLETSMAAITFNNALKSLATNKRNMELAKHVFEVSEKKFQQGVGNNLEIINAQTAMREAEINYFNSLYDAIISKIDYSKATGALINK